MQKFRLQKSHLFFGKSKAHFFYSQIINILRIMIATYYRYAIKILQDTMRFLIYKKIKKNQPYL